jgi:predicted nucleotidyltransferase
MGTNPDGDTAMTDPIIERTSEIARSIARAHNLTLARIIVYGSHAHGEATERSDIDLILVSPDWEDIDYYARPEPFLIEWPRDELPTPDIVPVTPAEFAQRSQNETDIVRTAVETGIVAG